MYALEVKNVTFSYEDQKTVLENINKIGRAHV